jgi:hypothetical protein
MIGKVDAGPIAESWGGCKRTRRDLDALATLQFDMTQQEVERRIRATSFGPWQPRIFLHGHVFELKQRS